MGIRSPEAMAQHRKLEAMQKAAALLVKCGVIELWPETGMYRLKPKVRASEQRVAHQ